MAERAASRPPMPTRLKITNGILYLQGVGNLFSGILLILIADDYRIEYQTSATADYTPALLWLFACLAILVSVVLLRCAALMRQGYYWIPVAVIAAEVVIVVGGFVSVLSGAVVALVGIALAAGVIAEMVHHESKEWFTRPAS